MRRLRQFFEASNQSNAGAYSDWNSVFRAEDLATAANKDKFDAFHQSDKSFLTKIFERETGDVISRALLVDQNSFLPFNLMDGADRMSMANSFELRLPFLSYDLMQFVNSLPSEFKIEGRIQKKLLKHAYRDALPDEILRRPREASILLFGIGFMTVKKQ